MPALTRFTFGAIHPLNVGDLTLAELSEYLTAMEKHEADQRRLVEQQQNPLRR